MVTDPNLAVHLAHFGIAIQTMQKVANCAMIWDCPSLMTFVLHLQTEKTIAEMELDMNKRYDEWSVLQESEAKLQPLYGPGYTGMINIGNSCYMNSIMQVLFVLREFKTKYAMCSVTVTAVVAHTICNNLGTSSEPSISSASDCQCLLLMTSIHGCKLLMHHHLCSLLHLLVYLWSCVSGLN